MAVSVPPWPGEAPAPMPTYSDPEAFLRATGADGAARSLFLEAPPPVQRATMDEGPVSGQNKSACLVTRAEASTAGIGDVPEQVYGCCWTQDADAFGAWLMTAAGDGAYL